HRLLGIDDERAFRAHDAFTVGLEGVRVYRGIGDGDDVVVAHPSLIVAWRVGDVVMAGELEGAVNGVLDRAFVLVEMLAGSAEAEDGERMSMPQEDAAAIGLMAAKLGEQEPAGFAIEPPANKLVQIFDTRGAQVGVAEVIAVLAWDLGPPAILVFRHAGLGID